MPAIVGRWEIRMSRKKVRRFVSLVGKRNREEEETVSRRLLQ